VRRYGFRGLANQRALISIFGPRLAIRYGLKRLLGSRETYRWPAYVFGCDTAIGCSVAIDDVR
jgi:all-trans-retinol 13,14-reductase